MIKELAFDVPTESHKSFRYTFPLEEFGGHADRGEKSPVGRWWGAGWSRVGKASVTKETWL